LITEMGCGATVHLEVTVYFFVVLRLKISPQSAYHYMKLPLCPLILFDGGASESACLIVVRVAVSLWALPLEDLRVCRRLACVG
jgi:hypothetical protein